MVLFELSVKTLFAALIDAIEKIKTIILKLI